MPVEIPSSQRPSTGNSFTLFQHLVLMSCQTLQRISLIQGVIQMDGLLLFHGGSVSPGLRLWWFERCGLSSVPTEKTLFSCIYTYVQMSVLVMVVVVSQECTWERICFSFLCNTHTHTPIGVMSVCPGEDCIPSVCLLMSPDSRHHQKDSGIGCLHRKWECLCPRQLVGLHGGIVYGILGAWRSV